MHNNRTTEKWQDNLKTRRADARLKVENLTDDFLETIFCSVNTDNANVVRIAGISITKCINECIADYRRWQSKDIAEQEIKEQLVELEKNLKRNPLTKDIELPDNAADYILKLLEAYFNDDYFLKQIDKGFGVWSEIKRCLLIHGDPNAAAQPAKRKRTAAALIQAAMDYHQLDDDHAQELFIAMMRQVDKPNPTSENGIPCEMGTITKKWRAGNVARITRDNVMRAAFGLRLNDKEAEKLFHSAQQEPFDPMNMYDTVIRYALRHGMTLMEATALYERTFLEFLQRLHDLPDWRGFGTYDLVESFDYNDAEQRIQEMLSLNEKKFADALIRFTCISKKEMIEALSLTSVLTNADAYTSALAAYANKTEDDQTREIMNSIVQALEMCRKAHGELKADEKVDQTKTALQKALKPYISQLEFTRRVQMKERLRKLLNLLKRSTKQIRLEMLPDELTSVKPDNMTDEYTSRIESHIKLVRESVLYEYETDTLEESERNKRVLDQRTAQLLAYLVDGVKVEQKGNGKNAFTDERILSLLHGETDVKRTDLLRLAYAETLMKYYVLKEEDKYYDEISIPTDEACEFFEETANELLKNAGYHAVYVRASLDCLMVYSICQAEECICTYQNRIPRAIEAETE